MGTALVYVVVVALVAAVVYLGVALLSGRGEELPPMPPGSTPTRLPAQDLAGDDVRGLRFQQTVRGYKMSEVDWALERLANEVDALRARLEHVEGRVDPTPTDPHIAPQTAPQTAPAPAPATASDRRTESRTETHHGHQ